MAQPPRAEVDQVAEASLAALRALAAGEALSEVWLTLTARGLAASPICEVIEVDAVRGALRRLLGGVSSPAIAMRIGVPVAETEPVPAAARRSGTDVVRLPGQPCIES
ncbi:hypothetical protein [Dactylosporangium sp. CA-139066]|uniref:hypothetical protein n=1 Tax=Dactylosporangium sp. CA-139066 TaxID=3239930 RepID=UPI003D8C14EC